MFFDLTLSLSKSISIFHASLGENTRLAPEAGDEAAAWQEAATALGYAADQGVLGMPGGLLLRLRDTCPAGTTWESPRPADKLRQARTGARDARLATARATAEADAARGRGDHGEAARHYALAASYQAMHDFYRQREATHARAVEEQVAWENAVRRQRQLAEIADAELRRRHPDQPWPRLRAAEPQPQSSTPTQERRETARQIPELAAQHHEYARRLSERQSAVISDDRYQAPALWSPAWAAAARDAILQPLKPQIQPSARVLERVADRDADWEAGD